MIFKGRASRYPGYPSANPAIYGCHAGTPRCVSTFHAAAHQRSQSFKDRSVSFDLLHRAVLLAWLDCNTNYSKEVMKITNLFAFICFRVILQFLDVKKPALGGFTRQLWRVWIETP